VLLVEHYDSKQISKEYLGEVGGSRGRGRVAGSLSSTAIQKPETKPNLPPLRHPPPPRAAASTECLA